MLSERQEQIIEESIKLIADKGIQGFTIKNLSKAIGFSEPAIYRHFNSKTDIISAILEKFLIIAAFLSKETSESNSSAFEKIAFIIKQMINMFTETPSLVPVIFSEEIFKNETALKEKIITILNKDKETIERIISEGQKNGEFRTDIDEKTLTLTVMGSLRLLVKKWDLENRKFNLKKESDLLISALNKILTV
ncbi:MAG: TetR/AcrR family transcriptional regulator [Chlorobi bacterium]|nr:TetR/AcrR family transcriptional regulator [Chlorobiota bacterium]